jgi:uncharacterized protein (TIGR02246 family)
MVQAGLPLRLTVTGRSRLTALSRPLLIVAAITMAFATTLSAQQPPPDQEIRDFLGNFVRAWNQADAKTLAAMFETHASFQTPSGHAQSRAGIEELLKRQEVEFFNGRQLSLEFRAIRFRSPNDAEVETDFLLDGYSAMGVGSVPPGDLFFVLRKADARWRIKQAIMQR